MAAYLDTPHPDTPEKTPRRRGRFWGKFLFFGAALLALVAVSAVLAGRWYLTSRMPKVDGTFSHPSLSGEVTVTRDDWGVPHIEAETEADAYFAYGFTIAQDRLFQMELHRRIAVGELAELIASEETIRLDKLARTLLWRKRAEDVLADEGHLDGDFLVVLDRFLAGVNHYIETAKMPVEFELLGIRPAPFTRVDSLAFSGYMAYGFAEGIQGDALYALVRDRHPEADVDALFPGYTREVPVTIMEGLTAPVERGPLDTAGQVDGDWAGMALLAREIGAVSAAFGAFHGSNSWVLGPSRTESGAAILANDPHMEFSNPHVWYEAHMRYGDYENYGVHLPLIPFPMIAHNGHKAWALTMFENDDTDLYRETFDETDPGRVMYRGEWVEAERWTEVIEVRGREDPIQFPVTVTPHGPIVTEFLTGYEGPPVSLWWGYLQAEESGLDVFYHVGHARTVEEVSEALSRWPAPGLNVSYADGAGNIAWWAAAKLPIRPAHVSGKGILDGASGADEIAGYVPFEENPRLVNPPTGVIVTANNLSTVHPVGGDRPLDGYWQPSDRAARILHLLGQRERWSIESLKAVQTDHVAESAPRIVPVVLKALEREQPSLTRTEEQALEALRVWDYRNSADSIGAAVYHHVNDGILKAAAGDEFGEEAYGVWRGLAESWNSYKALMADASSPIWNKVTTDTVETRDEIIVEGFRAGVARLREGHGDNPGGWMWGKVHTIEFEHALGGYELFGFRPLRRVFNIGPFGVVGATEDVNNLIAGSMPYAVVAGPSMRLLIDYGDLSQSQCVLPTGNSGHFMSRHFSDQTGLYIANEYRTIRFTAEQIAEHGQHTMRFTPGS